MSSSQRWDTCDNGYKLILLWRFAFWTEVPPTRQSNRLQEILKERIATCHYLPGLRLAEIVLSTEFNTSRTPIFEILMQLFTTDLIAMWQRCGKVVAEISSQRLYELFEIMAEIEALCGRLAA